MRPPSLSDHRGAVLVSVLIMMGMTGALLGPYLTILTAESGSIIRAAGRAQALYLAEAGLDAANDVLYQDWKNHQRASQFPMQESVTVSREGIAVTVGAFEVTVTELDANTLRVTSTGRSLPTGTGNQQQFRIERVLSMVVVRKLAPSFGRVGPPADLEVETNYFDKDGIPDLLIFSGDLVGEERFFRQRDGKPTLSSGGSFVRDTGLHLFASWTDVDMDGDLDLVLTDRPSRSEGSRGHGIPTVSLSDEESLARPMMLTGADVFGSGTPMSVAAQGWHWLPNDALTGTEPEADIFLNTPIYEGTRILSWGEIPIPPAPAAKAD